MKTNTTFKATVTLDKTQLAELIVWAVKHNCSGGLTFGANSDDDTVRMAVSVAEARAAIESTADLPRKGASKERSQRMAHQQQRRAAKDKRYILNELGRVDIDGSCRALGLSREELTSNRWKGGSTEHRVKCAIMKEVKRPTVAEQQEWYARKLSEAHVAARRPAPAKWPRPLVRKPSGAIDIEESLDSLGLSRATILRRQWKQGSNPHKVKAAIRCGWRAAVKAKREMKSAAAYHDHYSTNGNIMGEAEMKEKGLKDLSHVA